jgi:ATP-dependent exoDNAse (exonuclease V) beta subunit
MLIGLGMNLYSEQFRLLSKEQLELMGSKDLIMAIADYSKARIDEIASEISSKGKALVDEIAKNGFSMEDFSNKNSGVYGFISKCAKFKPYNEIFEVGKRTLEALETPDGDSWVSKDFVKKNPGRAGLLLENIAKSYHPQLLAIVQYMENNKTEYYTALSVNKNLDTLTVFNDIRDKVKEILAEENAMILADSGPLLREFIKGNDAPFVYEKIGTRYDCFMLDEFQDTSVIQWHNFKPLIGNSLAQDEFSMVVGDVKQAIYRWRNSDWRILANQIENDFSVDVRSLTKNHRSLYQIVEFNNSFFTTTSRFLIDWTKNLCGDNILDELLALVSKAYENPTQECKYSDKSSGFVEITHFSTSKDEAEDELLLQKFDKLIPDLVNRGYSIGDIAILVRKKSEGKRIADILLSLKHKYPEKAHLFNVVSQDALQLSASHAVQLCVAAMRLILNSTDTLSAAILSKEIMVIAEQSINWEYTFLDFDFDAEKQWLGDLRNLPLVSMFEAILQRYNLQGITKELPYLAVLHEQIIEISRIGAASLPYFVEWWEEKKGSLALTMPESGDAINIMTIHKSKGLQFPIVIVPYASIDIFKQDSRKLLWLNAEKAPYSNYPLYPISYSKYLNDSDFKGVYLEEKVQTMVDSINLLYVAFTRPEDELYVFIGAPDVKDDAKNTSDIILSPINKMDATINEREVDGEETPIVIKEYSFGTPQSKTTKKETDNNEEVWILENYSVSTKPLKIAQQLEASEFFKEEESKIVAGIEHGKLMHKLFSMIITSKDIDNALYSLKNEGIITEPQIEPLRLTVSKILENQPFADWFSENWAVKTESDILTKDAAIYRPDRIMMRNDQAVVVDYKFGEQLPKHHKQVQNYMQLIKGMNYSDVKGYIWYVDNGALVQID